MFALTLSTVIVTLVAIVLPVTVYAKTEESKFANNYLGTYVTLLILGDIVFYFAGLALTIVLFG